MLDPAPAALAGRLALLRRRRLPLREAGAALAAEIADAVGVERQAADGRVIEAGPGADVQHAALPNPRDAKEVGPVRLGACLGRRQHGRRDKDGDARHPGPEKARRGKGALHPDDSRSGAAQALSNGWSLTASA